MGRVAAYGSVEPSTGEGPVPAGAVPLQIEKILQSESFRNSESLRGLLLYLGRLHVEKPDGSISEHDLAISVFGRRGDFDSRTDSVVRVHIGRLRSRLAEYYMSEGVSDDVLIEIPKGRYCLIARNRSAARTHEAADSSPGLDHQSTLFERRKKWFWRGPVPAVFSGLVLLAMGTCLGWFLHREVPPPARSTLWRDFIRQPRPTLVIFSNPTFIGSPYKGMHLFRPGVDSTNEINDFYSGSGEVVAVHRLTETFHALQSFVQVKRAQSLSWDEVDRRSLIIVGSPAQNLPAREIPLGGFHFTHGETANEIVNESPGQGEPAVFRTLGPPYSADYAIVSYGDSPNRVYPAMVLAGTTTYGTQAAAEFVTSEEGVTNLLGLLGVRRHQPVPHFTVILEQKIIGGAIVQSRPVLVRTHGGASKERR